MISLGDFSDFRTFSHQQQDQPQIGYGCPALANGDYNPQLGRYYMLRWWSLLPTFGGFLTGQTGVAHPLGPIRAPPLYRAGHLHLTPHSGWVRAGIWIAFSGKAGTVGLWVALGVLIS